jgi:hypothetical protein
MFSIENKGQAPVSTLILGQFFLLGSTKPWVVFKDSKKLEGNLSSWTHSAGMEVDTEADS